MLAEKYKYTINTKEELIEELKNLNLTRKMVILNIKKYGYEEYENEILAKLGFFIDIKKEQKTDKYVNRQAEIFKLMYDCNRNNCFIRMRSKYTKKTKAYNFLSLQNTEKLNSAIKYTFDKDNKKDLFYSLNLFGNMYRADEQSLISLQNIAIDVDFNKDKYTIEEVLKAIDKKVEDKELLEPTLIEYGNRIRLIYSFNDVAVTKKSLIIYKKVGEAIAEKLKEFGASAQPSTTFARFVGCENTKTGDTIKYIIKNKYKYNLRDLQNTFLNITKFIKPKNNIKTQKNVIKFFNLYTLNLSRLQDLEKIQRIRQEGYREILCYLYRNYCLKAGFDENEARQKTEEFNSKFINPLKNNELDSDTKHLNRKQYLHKNESILNILDIEEKEEQQLNLKTIISKREKQRRNNKYNKEKYNNKIEITKRQRTENETKKILELKNQGFTQKQIAKKLDINIRTLKRRLANLKG